MDIIGQAVTWISRSHRTKMEGKVICVIQPGEKPKDVIDRLGLSWFRHQDKYNPKPTPGARYLVEGYEKAEPRYDKKRTKKRHFIPYYAPPVTAMFKLAAGRGKLRKVNFPPCPVCNEELCGAVANQPNFCECYTCGNIFERVSK